MSPHTESNVHQWPKLDLHCHLEGAMRPATILDLYRQNHNQHLTSTVEDIIPLVQINGTEQGFHDWLPLFDTARRAIQTQDDIVRITVEAVEDAARENVVYFELRYSPFFINEVNDLAPEAVVAAAIEGRRQAAARFPDLPVEMILIAQQTGGEAECNAVVDLAEQYRDAGHGSVDIAGDMTRLPLDLYGPIFTRAHDAGLNITVHAGELAPAYTVRTAVEELHASRVGHGIRAIDDPAVVDLLIERDILLEVCITSNLQSRAAPSLAEHPIRALNEAGVKVCINTDDPGISAITLTDEYRLALNKLGFTPEQLGQFNRNAAQAAFTDDITRRRVQEIVNTAYTTIPQES